MLTKLPRPPAMNLTLEQQRNELLRVVREAYRLCDSKDAGEHAQLDELLADVVVQFEAVVV